MDSGECWTRRGDSDRLSHPLTSLKQREIVTFLGGEQVDIKMYYPITIKFGEVPPPRQIRRELEDVCSDLRQLLKFTKLHNTFITIVGVMNPPPRVCRGNGVLLF